MSKKTRSPPIETPPSVAERQHELYLAAEDELGALALARRQAEDSPPGAARERWTARAAELGRRIRRQWGAEAVSDPAPLAELPGALGPDWGLARAGMALAGRELVLAAAAGRRLSVAVVDVEGAAITTRVSLDTPEPLGSRVMISLDEDRLWAVGESGWVLELARGGWEILGWRSLDEVLWPEIEIRGAAVLPGGTHLWLEVRDRSAPQRSFDETLTVDLRTWRRTRRPIARRPAGRIGAAGRRGMVFPDRNCVEVFSAAGKSVDYRCLPLDLVLCCAALSQDGEGLFALAASDPETSDQRLVLVRVELAAFDDETPDARVLDDLTDLRTRGAHAIAVDHDRALCFVLGEMPGGHKELMAYAVTPTAATSVSLLYRLALPHSAILVPEAQERRAVVVLPEEAALQILPLGPERPDYRRSKSLWPEDREATRPAPRARVGADVVAPPAELVYELSRAAGDLPAALEAARRGAGEAADGAAREPWEARAAELRSRLRAAWRVEVASDRIPLAELPNVWPSHYYDDRGVVLDGGELVLAATWGEWLFFAVVDVAEATVTARVSLRTPEPMTGVVISAGEDRLWALSSRGRLLEIDRRGWEILRWRSLEEWLWPGLEVLHAEVAPGGSHLWLQVAEEGDDESNVDSYWSSLAVDLRTWRCGRRGIDGWWRSLIPHPSHPGVVFGSGSTLQIFSTDGREALRCALPAGSRLESAATSPDGQGLILLVQPHRTSRREDVSLLRLATSGGGEVRLLDDLAGVHPRGRHALATALDSGLGFVLVNLADESCELRAFSVSDTGTAELYRVALPGTTVLVRDRLERRAVAFVPGAGSLGLLPLGPEPPAGRPQSFLAPESLYDHDRLPDLRGPWRCDSFAFGAGFLARKMKLAEDRGEYVRELESDYAGDVDNLIYLALAFSRLGEAEETARRLRRLLAAEPANARVILAAAGHEAESGRWAEVSRLLATVEPQGLRDKEVSHVDHLLGLALLDAGRYGAAAEVFARGKKAGGRDGCVFDPLIALARAMAETKEAAGAGDDPGAPRVAQLVRVIRAADRATSAGNPEAAVAVLERSVAWRSNEIQSAARLAAVHLGIRARSAAQIFAKRLALSFYRVVYHRGWRHDVGVPPLRWEEPRLAELLSRAEAWLDESSEAR